MSKVDLSLLVNKYSDYNEVLFNGFLMYKDTEIAIIENNNLYKTLHKELLPVIMMNENKGAFEAWLQTRVIDTHRTNSRHIRRRLSIKSDMPNEIVVKARAVCITDNYWLKWSGENLTYKEVRNKLSDGLNSLALYGNSDEVNFEEIHITPELTNIGSFEKCWKIINGKWYMIKKASYKENFAEVLICRIALSLGFQAVEYESIDNGKLVRCPDFTNNAEVDFEPMFSFVRDYWDTDNAIEIINNLGFIKEFLDITFMDALCYNIDRHTYNFGILRRDGKPIKLAPNFDNNLGLSGVLDNEGLKKTWYSTAFTRHNYIPILKKYKYKMINIDMEQIKKIINETLKSFPTLNEEKEFKEIVFQIIKNNYEELKHILME